MATFSNRKPLTLRQVYRGAERLDARHCTEEYTNAVFQLILDRACEKLQAQAKARRARPVFFVKSIPQTARTTARNSNLTIEELIVIARRLALSYSGRA